MRRSRGGVCGLLLILLGAWGALVPFVGPYFHYAYTPDRTWAYTSGRLWLEVAPGVAAVLGGLIVLATRSRMWGALGALLAALGGAWFVVGAAVTAQFIKSGSIKPGLPVGTSAGAAASSLRQFLEGLGFFTGTGLLIVFFAAIALGRFSATSVTVGDVVASDSLVGDTAAGGIAGQQSWTARETPADEPQTQGSYPASQDQYPTVASQYPPASQGSPAGQAPPRQDLFHRPEAQQEETTGQFPASSSATGEYPSSSSADSGENQF
jgi:hypothetical protein